jgi:hypothetical protein
MPHVLRCAVMRCVCVRMVQGAPQRRGSSRHQGPGLIQPVHIQRGPRARTNQTVIPNKKHHRPRPPAAAAAAPRRGAGSSSDLQQLGSM